MEGLINNILIAIGGVGISGLILYPIYLLFSGVTSKKANLNKFKGFATIAALVVGYSIITSIINIVINENLASRQDQVFKLIIPIVVLGLLTSIIHPLVSNIALKAYKDLEVKADEAEIQKTNYLKKVIEVYKFWYLPTTFAIIVIELIYKLVFKSDAGYSQVIFLLILLSNKRVYNVL
jgi:hypothetical protein